MTTGKYNNINVNRLYELNEKVSAKEATFQEKNELMRILYENDSIPSDMYANYINGTRTEALLKTGVRLGNLILLGYILEKKFG